jgi:catalase
MDISFRKIQRAGALAVSLAASALCAGAATAADGQAAEADPSANQSLTQQIFDTMLKAGAKPGYRVAHAKGIVCQGTFAPSKDAATLSKAAHFRAASVPVTARFSCQFSRRRAQGASEDWAR